MLLGAIGLLRDSGFALEGGEGIEGGVGIAVLRVMVRAHDGGGGGRGEKVRGGGCDLYGLLMWGDRD